MRLSSGEDEVKGAWSGVFCMKKGRMMKNVGEKRPDYEEKMYLCSGKVKLMQPR